jgi:hypothetical protein
MTEIEMLPRGRVKSKLEGVFDTRHSVRIAEHGSTVVKLEHTRCPCRNPLH